MTDRDGRVDESERKKKRPLGLPLGAEHGRKKRNTFNEVFHTVQQWGLGQIKTPSDKGKQKKEKPSIKRDNVYIGQRARRRWGRGAGVNS